MILLIVSLLLMLIGLAGVLLPFLPGVPIAWLGLFVYDYGTGFDVLPQYTSLVFFILTVISIALEFALPILGAKKYKASKYGLLGAALGLLIGPFVAGPVGVIVGPLLGAIIGEYIAGKKSGQAFQSGFGTFVGFMVSVVLRLVLVFVMMGYFVFHITF